MSNYMELPLSGLEAPLDETERAFQDACHKFAKEVMRPAGLRLDKLSAADMVAEGSELWDVIEKSKALGLNLTEMVDMEPAERVKLLAIASEELAWGDCGLACQILTAAFPVLYSLMADRMDLAEYCEGKLGCWGITEPDHGTDMLDANGALSHPNGSYGRPNCVARIEGDKVIINGQKSAWVSGGITAEVCALFCHVEVDGETRPGVALIVDLNSPGVTRGQPLEKMGVRTLNQGEIFFDNVEVPAGNILAGPDSYQDFVYRVLAEANPLVAIAWLGNTRAAYELALEYAHERKAGGVAIIMHQSVRSRLFHMFRKLELSRALIRRVLEFNATAEVPALHGSAAAKVTTTQLGFEVCSDALQIFGGNGMTKEYPMEKLLRDARAGLIADGCNEMLAIKGGGMLVNEELL
ncbi:MAG: acyl-CoA dehydrogenase family protein [Halioglobus sp.]|nr:acyl-CoA dehydrogenase family protein [Halioglobus sp.]